MLPVSAVLFFGCAVAGWIFGLFTGMVPGIHTNNIAAVLAGSSAVLYFVGLTPVFVSVVILSCAISHTFHNIIPAIFLGAPGEDTVLAVLPGHRLLLAGEGYTAVRLSALGSVGSILISPFLMIPMAFFLHRFYPVLEPYMGWFLLILSLIILLSEKELPSIVRATFVFLAAGFLGLLAFGLDGALNPVSAFSETSVLMPLLSGLFGVPQIIISLLTDSEIPTVREKNDPFPNSLLIRNTIIGTAAGAFVSWIPGISSSVAAILAGVFTGKQYPADSSINAGSSNMKEPVGSSGNTESINMKGPAVSSGNMESINMEGPAGFSGNTESINMDGPAVSSGNTKSINMEGPAVSSGNTKSINVEGPAVSSGNMESINLEGPTGEVRAEEPDLASVEETNAKEFIISVSAISTANAVFGLLTFFVLGKSRSGAIVSIRDILSEAGIGEVSPDLFFLFYAVVFLTGFLSYFSTLEAGRRIPKFLRKINYKYLSVIVLIFLSLLTFLMTGSYGFILFLASVFLGFMPVLLGVRKSHLMGVILFPVMLYFLGLR